MRCSFRKDPDGTCVCTVCGLRVHGEDPAHIYCQCPGRPIPKFHQKAIHYARAVGEHIATGFQTRTDEEVSALILICHSCEFFQNDTCRVCGCRINSGNSAFTNKLRMKTQTCPKGKWK